MIGVSTEEAKSLLAELPAKWERLGDLALLPNKAMTSPAWQRMPGAWDVVARALSVDCLARQAPVAATGASRLSTFRYHMHSSLHTDRLP